ncbi:hypothetical protein OE88DRAFT_1661713 [Heliocybe sulcata]|uniref:Uncharacterized protein n=1 Tax=Heliocybe sulcata TaxID=5364 RepID=A0A5C3MYN1_9AGAM|nr:hypothetical protein OE88DRAFT_1661713 [Heliocybe sulcata]
MLQGITFLPLPTASCTGECANATFAVDPPVWLLRTVRQVMVRRSNSVRIARQRRQTAFFTNADEVSPSSYTCTSYPCPWIKTYGYS